MQHTHIGPKVGWLHVGYKGEKFREIDLLGEVRRPLHDYLLHGGRNPESPYVFTSKSGAPIDRSGHSPLVSCSQAKCHKGAMGVDC